MRQIGMTGDETWRCVEGAAADALDNHEIGWRGAIIEHHFAVDELGRRLESGGRVGVGSFLAEGGLRNRAAAAARKAQDFICTGHPFCAGINYVTRRNMRGLDKIPVRCL